MKKMKKVFAMLLAFAMVMGMSLTTFAAKKPEATDEATITVNGVEKDVTVTAYKIAKADYNDAGLLGYSKVVEADVIDIYNPTEAQVAALAQKYRGTDGLPLSYTDGAYKLTTNAGLYLILVSNSNTTVYNPMVVSLAYLTEGKDMSGSWNELQPGAVTAASNFEFDGKAVYAKSKEIGLTKEITTEGKKSAYADDAAYGDTATFEIETSTPDYSEEYTNVEFVITDSMDTSLDLVADSVVVSAGSAEKDKDYEVETSTNGFVVTFKSEWVLKNASVPVVITYSATLNNTAKLGEANVNTATLVFTNEPNNTTTASASTNHYSFKTNGEIVKVGKEDKVLPGAEFKLTNTVTKKEYVATSDVEGKLEFAGLDEGTYTLVETKAPAGYSLNDKVYTVKVVPTYDANVKTLVSYDVTIDDAQTVNIPNTPLSGLPATGGIGTAVFTIGGCAIMIAAAYFFLVSRKKES